jgi:hypothetical protein
VRISTPIASTKPPQQATKTIHIICDSPGVRIEVNDDYVGDAPVSITVPTDRAKFTKVTIIRATPTLQGEYVQSKHFDATSEVPSRILFNMGLVMRCDAVFLCLREIQMCICVRFTKLFADGKWQAGMNHHRDCGADNVRTVAGQSHD